jgi:hypothetical protein
LFLRQTPKLHCPSAVPCDEHTLHRLMAFALLFIFGINHSVQFKEKR